MRILIVDDEEMMLKALRFQLEKDHYEVVEANDGVEALRLIQEEKFDLIISDVAMPHLSGLELMNYLKSNLFEIPVILISALDNKELVLTSLNLGADDFITKPINMEELSIRVKEFL